VADEKQRETHALGVELAERHDRGRLMEVLWTREVGGMEMKKRAAVFCEERCGTLAQGARHTLISTSPVNFVSDSEPSQNKSRNCLLTRAKSRCCAQGWTVALMTKQCGAVAVHS
jgi:hypothetical protein